MELKNKTFRDEYYELLKPWLEGDFKDYPRKEIDFQPESGRKRVLKNPKQMAEIALEYFVQRECASKPITYIGLILKLGLSSRSALDNYLRYDENNSEFKHLINTVKLIIQEKIEQDLYGKEFRAAQFLLKTNYKYTEIITNIVENREYKIDVRDPDENINQ